MDEDAKKTIAVFRFGVIADLVGGRKLLRGEKEALLREKASLQWEIPFSLRSHISRSTILSWMRSYEKGGRRLESLYPEERKDKGRYRVMDEEAIAALIQLRKERMGITLPVLLKEARAKGILPPHYMVSYSGDPSLLAQCPFRVPPRAKVGEERVDVHVTQARMRAVFRCQNTVCRHVVSPFSWRFR